MCFLVSGLTNPFLSWCHKDDILCYHLKVLVLSSTFNLLIHLDLIWHETVNSHNTFSNQSIFPSVISKTHSHNSSLYVCFALLPVLYSSTKIIYFFSKIMVLFPTSLGWVLISDGTAPLPAPTPSPASQLCSSLRISWLFLDFPLSYEV